MNILEPLNRLIMAVADAGMSNTVYQLWHIVNITVATLFLLSYRKHYGIKRVHAVLTPLIIYALGYIFIILVGWIATRFQHLGSNNIVKGFCFFALVAVVPARLFKLEWKRIMDYTAPGFALLQFTAHLACNFAGCCRGYPMAHGIWNPNLHDYLFPIQLVESFVSLLIFFACLILAKKQEYRVSGRVYPFFLITFGITRFFLEFLRDNTKLFWGISELALWALLMVVVGTVWLIVDKKKAKNPEKA